MSSTQDFSFQELEVVGALMERLDSTRAERQERVAGIIQQLMGATDLERLVAQVQAETLLRRAEDEDEYNAFAVPEELFCFQTFGPSVRAELVFSGYDDMHDALMETGEFVDLQLMRDANDALGFVRKHSFTACALLYKWAADREPKSQAAKDVEKPGVLANKFDLLRNLMFHKDFIDLYIKENCRFGDQSRPIVHPIIVLAGTNDWDLATSMMTPKSRNRLENSR